MALLALTVLVGTLTALRRTLVLLTVLKRPLPPVLRCAALTVLRGTIVGASRYLGATPMAALEGPRGPLQVGALVLLGATGGLRSRTLTHRMCLTRGGLDR